MYLHTICFLFFSFLYCTKPMTSRELQPGRLLHRQKADCTKPMTSRELQQNLLDKDKKENCTKAFRKKHYHLSGVQIHTCENYIEDIRAYIAMFPAGIFPSLPEQEEVLHISGKKVEATAYISGNQFVVCKGSEFSITETSSCPVHIRKHRKELMDEGKVQAGRFTEDVPFSSPSAAAACVIGGSADGRKMWLYPDGKSIKEKDESAE